MGALFDEKKACSPDGQEKKKKGGEKNKRNKEAKQGGEKKQLLRAEATRRPEIPGQQRPLNEISVSLAPFPPIRPSHHFLLRVLAAPSPEKSDVSPLSLHSYKFLAPGSMIYIFVWLQIDSVQTKQV